MKIKQWLIGAAGSLVLGVLAVPADAAPFGGAPNSAPAGNAVVHKAFGWGHGGWGHRHHYRPYRYYRPCSYDYGGCGPHYYSPYAYYGGHTPYYYRPYAYPGYFYAPRIRRHHHRRWHRW